MAGFYGAAQADALRDAANNEGGAAIGFMGMNMAGNANGINVGDMMAQGQARRAAQAQQAAARQAAPAGGWTCACGHSGNTGRFCSECGAAKPDDGWTCACGAKNTGKFCSECGKPRPAGDWVCACGAKNSGKFCAECGSPRP
jgi:membrane protease subunit (stomatin/prohibitin family)